MAFQPGLGEVTAFLNAALECSVFVCPKDPGLTYEELLEVGGQAGLQPGELDDALSGLMTERSASGRLLPGEPTRAFWCVYLPEEPDYRNLAAFDFAISELRARVKADGANKAQLDRAVLVERAVAAGIDRHDIEVAATVLAMCGHFVETDGVLRFARGREHHQLLPSEQRQQRPHQMPLHRKPARERAYPYVKEVIARRTDGRPAKMEAFDAFSDELGRLGQAPFRLWWTQLVRELRRSDPSVAPVSMSVLAAALAEGALLFLATYARAQGLGVFQDLGGDPTQWRLRALVTSASRGGDVSVLDAHTRQRADALGLFRQRIHAGRMLADFPTGIPDMRPEEARDARGTAELVARRAVDWLRRHAVPATAQANS